MSVSDFRYAFFIYKLFFLLLIFILIMIPINIKIDVINIAVYKLHDISYLRKFMLLNLFAKYIKILVKNSADNDG